MGRDRKSTVITVGDVERVGVEKIAEMALEIAWKGAKAVYLSFDIDVIDAGFVPGTGWPEPGGLLPREALNLVKMVSEPGLAGIEVVECSPPYDWAEQTALMSSRVILDSLAAQVRSGKLGNKSARATGPPGGRTRGWNAAALLNLPVRPAAAIGFGDALSLVSDPTVGRACRGRCSTPRAGFCRLREDPGEAALADVVFGLQRTKIAGVLVSSGLADALGEEGAPRPSSRASWDWTPT